MDEPTPPVDGSNKPAQEYSPERVKLLATHQQVLAALAADPTLKLSAEYMAEVRQCEAQLES